MNIIDAYHYYAIDYIEHDPTFHQYEQDLKEKSSHINNLLINTSALDKFRHPIRLMRTKHEAKRLSFIGSEYDRIKNSGILEHCDEEDSDIEFTLSWAAEHYKPKHMKEFTDMYPVYVKTDRKLLK